MPPADKLSRFRRPPMGWALVIVLAGALAWFGVSAGTGVRESGAAGDGCYKLALSVAAGNGTVQATPSSAGGCADGQYPKDYKVSVLATASAGYSFADWKGADDAKTNPTSVTMKSARQVAAYFSSNCLTLTLTVGSGSGTVGATPTSAGGCPDGQYPLNYKVSVVATPSSGYGFTGWQGIDDTKSNPASVTMKSDHALSAYFASCYRLIISISGHGSVQATPASAGGCPDGRYPSGSSVTLLATPNDGYNFNGWAGADNNKPNPAKVSIKADRHVTAIFLSIAATATPTKPSGPEKTATPTKASAEATPTPTKPSGQEKTPTPTKAPVEATPTPTKPSGQEKTPTPTKASVEATPTPTKASVEATPTPTKAAAEATPTPTKVSDHEQTATPTTQSEPAKTATPTPVVELRGDADCSGHVTPVDAVLVLQLDAGMITHVGCPEAADVNHDGRVNSVDATIILQASAGLVAGF